ncbi:MAG: stealth conserved region 3 domain-containing protein [Methyloceanibacter sp.]|nr:stealth conserved region 3 domain-containing protein [Methyloceanibacter sp.]
MDISALARHCSKSDAFTLGTVDANGRHFWRFELFERNDMGALVSRAATNKTAGILYADFFRNRGVVNLEELMPELRRPAGALTIDLVYTWVNHADERWRKSYSAALSGDASADAISQSRFHSNDELRYSLRSAHHNLPWVQAIHIVSNCHPPDWLDVSHPKIRWVRHETILPPDCLPTFNSHAIEASLHRVPDLAENFLYLNDDFLVLDAFPPSAFVNDNGTLNANLERQGVVKGPVSCDSPDYLNAARNSARLLFERFGYYPTRLHRHTPYSLSKSLLYELEADFPEEFARTRRAQFRSINDLNVTSFLAHHYGFIKRAVVYHGYSSALLKSNDPFVVQRLQDLMQGRQRASVACLNEGGTPAPTPFWRRKAAAFMAQAFPGPAPWERL